MGFNPMLTPKQILISGAFGGCYFGVEVEKKGDYNYQKLFDEALDGVDPTLYLSTTYKTKVNKFKTSAGLSYQEWKKKGWIHEDDPYGWFEWYLKYHSGRRHPDDARQIKRWHNFCGPDGRWRRTIYKKIHATGNWDVSPRIQQSLLHWGYQVNQKDYEDFLDKNDL